MFLNGPKSRYKVQLSYVPYKEVALMVTVKKVLMKHVWRLQQVGGLLSVMMLSITNTLLIRNYLDYIFVDVLESLGVPSVIDYDYIITGTLALMIFGGALFIGYLYDRTFQMWRAQNEVAVERNPYSKVLLSPKEIVAWQKNSIPMLKSMGNEKEAKFLQSWVDRCLKENPTLQKEVDEVERWVVAA